MDQEQNREQKTEAFKALRKISLIPVSPSQIPQDDVLLSEAHFLLDDSRTWPVGKTYEGTKTQLYRARTGKTGRWGMGTSKQSWHCLVTNIHKADRDEGQSPSLGFSRVWSKLGHDKVWYQKSYLTEISKVTRIKYLSESQSIWTMLVSYPPPMSPRVFTFFQASWLLEHTHLRRGIVVTLPITLGSQTSENLAEIEERGVRGRFVSVEHLQEMDENVIEWRRVVSVDLGGFASNFWAARGRLKRLVTENSLFVNWLKSLKSDETKRRSSQTEQIQEGSTRSFMPQSHRNSQEEEVFHYEDGDTNTENVVG